MRMIAGNVPSTYSSVYQLSGLLRGPSLWRGALRRVVSRNSGPPGGSLGCNGLHQSRRGVSWYCKCAMGLHSEAVGIGAGQTRHENGTLVTASDITAAELPPECTWIVDASSFRHEHRALSQGLTSGRALRAQVVNAHVIKILRASNITQLIFMFDDASRHPAMRTEFLKDTRYAEFSENKYFDPARKYINQYDGRLYAHGQGPVGPDVPLVIEDDIIAPSLVSIIDTRCAVYYEYMCRMLLELKHSTVVTSYEELHGHPLHIYVRTPQSSHSKLLSGDYVASDGAPPLHSFRYGEVDIEAHQLAAVTPGEVVIQSNDWDHVMQCLLYENNRVTIVRHMKTKKHPFAAYSAARLLAACPPMFRRTVVYMLIVSGTDTCNTIGISSSLTGRYIEHMIRGHMTPFVRHSGPEADQTVVNVKLLREYVGLVRGLTKKRYQTAREMEIYYVLRPMWTLEYLCGHDPMAVLGERVDAGSDAARYFPFHGCHDPNNFYITEAQPFVRGQDNAFLMINVDSPKNLVSRTLIQGTTLLKEPLPKRIVIRRTTKAARMSVPDRARARAYKSHSMLHRASRA